MPGDQDSRRASPPSIATPPKYGIGIACTSRSRTWRHRTGAQRELAGHDAEQVGDRRRRPGRRRGTHAPGWRPRHRPRLAASGSTRRARTVSSGRSDGWPVSEHLRTGHGSAPTQDLGRSPVQSTIVRRRRPAVGPASRITRDLGAEHLVAPRRRRWRPAAPVVLALLTASGPVRCEQLEGHLVVGHPHGDGAAGVAEVPLQRAAAGGSTSVERPGPELLDQRARPRRDADRQRVERGARPTPAPAAACRGRGPWRRAAGCTAPGSKASAADAVDGVGREHDQLAARGRRARPRRGPSSRSVVVGGVEAARSRRSSVPAAPVIVPVSVANAATCQVAVVADVGPAAGCRRRPPARTRPARRRARPRRRRRAQQPGRRRARRRASRRARRRRTTAPAPGRGRAPRARRTPTRRAGCTAGCATTTSTVPSRSANASAMSPSAQVDTRCRRGCAAAHSSAPARRARPRAPRAAGTSWATDSAIAPEPVHRSTTTGDSAGAARAASTAQPASSSVSGRGTNTPGPDRERRRSGSRPTPVRCCSGSRAARRATSASKARLRLLGVDAADERQRGRAACRARGASSSSASCSGTGDPGGREPAGGRLARPAGARGAHGHDARARRAARSRSASTQRRDHRRRGRRRGPGRGCRPCSRCGGRRSGSPGSCRCGSARSGRPCAPASGARRTPRRRPASWAAASSRARRMRIACSGSAAGSSRSGSWHTMPVGRCVIRTAESVVLTLCPPGPDGAEDVDAQVVVVDRRRRPCSASGHHQDAGGARCGRGPGSR